MATELRVRARSEREGGQQQVDRPAERPRMSERAEVPAALPPDPSRDERPRPRRIRRDRQPGVALVVLESDVEAWLKRLDQGHLEDECLDLSAGHRPFEPISRGDHLRRSGMEVARILEVRGDPVAQGARLAHVEHPALVVEELVAPRLIRNACRRWAKRHA